MENKTIWWYCAKIFEMLYLEDLQKRGKLDPNYFTIVELPKSIPNFSMIKTKFTRLEANKQIY